MFTAQFKDKIPVACFAPDLSDAKLTEYKTLIDAMPNSEVKDAMQECLTCVLAWWNLSESTRTDVAKYGILHQGREIEYQVTPLEKEHVDHLFDVTPWLRECEAMKPLFEQLTGDVRNAAHHLLWHCIEISQDREPLTVSKLQ